MSGQGGRGNETKGANETKRTLHFLRRQPSQALATMDRLLVRAEAEEAEEAEETLVARSSTETETEEEDEEEEEEEMGALIFPLMAKHDSRQTNGGGDGKK